MADNAQPPSTSPPPPPPPPAFGAAAGGPNPGQVVLESLGVLTKPETVIPRIVDTPGFMVSGLLAAIYVIVVTLSHILQWPGLEGPPFKVVVRDFLAQIVQVVVLAGIVGGAAVTVLGRPEVKINQAANAVAVALVPAVIVQLIVCIAALIWPRLGGWLMPLSVVVLPVFLVAALEKGLRCDMRAAIYTALVAWFVAMAISNQISGGVQGAMAWASLADVNRAMNELPGLMGGVTGR